MLNGLGQHIPNIILLKITLIEALIVLNSTPKTRSGGHPKFPPLFQLEEGIDNDYYNTNFTTVPQAQLFDHSHIAENNIQIDCGKRTIRHYPLRNGKIVGGSVAPYGAYPWQVEIQIYNEEKNVYEHHCGGALVGDRMVLTAAHCIYVSFDCIQS